MTVNHEGVEIGQHTDLIPHPQWCSRDYCQTTAEGDVCHRSTPVVLKFRDCSAAIHLEAADEPGEPWRPEATVRILPALTWPDGRADLYLSPEEMLQLQDRLATERQRALLLTAPVVRAAVTS